MTAIDWERPKNPMEEAENKLTVLCLCADWCGVCRDYRSGYEALAADRPDVDFHWVDIEDEAEWPDELEVESFPTVLIQRDDTVLFFGPTLPQHGHLLRTLDSLKTLGDAEARRYVADSVERQSWQKAREFSALLSRRRA